MLEHFTIRSHLGNIVLGVVGVVYSVAALVLLIYYLVTSWSVASLVDRALQIVLAVTVATGVGFVSIARHNLAARP